MDGAICRHISTFGYLRLAALDDPILDAESLAISKSDLPELLRLPPDRAQPLRPLPQVGLVIRDAHVHDVVVAAPRVARLGKPGHGLDDELHGLETAAGGRVVDVAH